MKKIVSTIAVSVFTILFFQSYGQSSVALHHGATITIFYNSAAFADAYAASVNGDTIYLAGGFYAGLTIDKQLAIFGAGHHPDSTKYTFATQINGSLTFGPNADSSHIEGLHITGNISVTAANNKIDRLRIRRNIIDGLCSMNGDRVTPSLQIEISGNIIRSTVDLSNTLNVVLNNNIFQSRVYYVFQGSVVNNVFTSNPYVSWAYAILYDVDNTRIESNIFVSAASPDIFVYCDNSGISKNLIAYPSPNYNSNMATGNWTGVVIADIFMNYTSASFLYTDNYHLKTPASYVGKDGTQVGIYGGLRPWKEGSVPLNPHIQSSNIPLQTNASGQLNIQVKVAAQNN